MWRKFLSSLFLLNFVTINPHVAFAKEIIKTPSILAQNNGISEEKLAEVENLIEQAYKLYQQGKYKEAEPLYKQALAIRKEVLGDKHPSTATSLNNLALLYYSQGNYKEAEPLYKQALAIYKEVLGDKHPDTATSLNNLALLYYSQGNYTEAEPLYKQALAISKEVLGDKHPSTATSLNNLAGLYESQGNYKEAEPLYKQALAIRKEVLGDKHPSTASSLNSLAGLYYSQGNYKEAEPLYKQALAIRKEVLGDKHPYTATSLNNLAGLYYSQGNYKEAEPLYKQALAIRKEVLGDKHPSTASSLNSLAGLYYSQGNYKEAEPLYKQALAIRKEVLGDKHPYTATSLNNLAGLYYSQGNYKEAEPLYKQALAIRKEVLGDKHPSTATSLNNLAGLYWGEDNLTLALNNLTLGTDIEEYNLGNFLNQIGDEARKQAYIQTISGTIDWSISLHLNTAPNNPEATNLALTTILRRKGRVLDAMSNIVAILRQRLNPEIQSLFDNLAEKRTQLATVSFQGLGNLSITAYRNLITTLETDIQQLETNLSSQSAEFKIENQPITIKAIQQVMPQNTALLEYMVYKPFNPKTQEWGKPHYAAYVLHPNGEAQGIDLGEVEKIDKLIYTWRGNLSADTLPLPALRIKADKELKANGQELYRLIFKPLLPFLKNTHTVFISPDSQLNLIPFAALMDDDGNYLVKNYSLTYLTSGRDLLKLQNPVKSRSNSVIVANPNYGTNLQLIAKNRGKRSADLSNLECCISLPGTKEEAEKITELFAQQKIPQPQVFTENQAVVDSITAVKAPTILHLATHGFFLPEEKEVETPNKLLLNNDNKLPIITNENPLLRAGLAFAGFNPSEKHYDGALTALQAANLDLWGTKVVVLSACETGIGDVLNGEGVYGLRRAFVLAGTESQLMSLWTVDDLGTKELMIKYYQKLMTGVGRSDALREVQLEMINSKEFSNPLFWAAFIPSGDWRSMQFNQN